MYVIQSGNRYVCRGEHSYTRNLEKATIFDTIEQAQQFGICEGEFILSLNTLLDKYHSR